MSLRLVRCPYCGKRFNVAGIAAGTRLRCGGCTAVLTVPRPEASTRPSLRLTRSLVLQVAGGVAAGLVAAVALYVLLRPVPEAPPAPLAAAPEKSAAKASEPAPGIIDQEFPALVDPYASVQRRLQQEFGPTRFIFHRVKPYFVALETSERYHMSTLADEYGKRLERLYAAFRRELGDSLQLPHAEPPLVVLVFNSRESFDRYFLERDKKRMSDSIKGIYEYDRERRRVVVYHDYNVTSEVLFHEGIHQLVHYYTLRETEGRRVLGSYWFQEGLGTYFEGLRRGEGGEFIDPAGGRDRLPTLKQALLPRAGARPEFIPLNVLVGLTVDDFWQWFEELYKHDPEEATQKARLYYAESWAFVHFLRQKDGNYRKLFDDYFRRELAGRGGKEPFEALVRHYLRTELPELEGEFIAYIHGLR
jgi:hypothetical protein